MITGTPTSAHVAAAAAGYEQIKFQPCSLFHDRSHFGVREEPLAVTSNVIDQDRVKYFLEEICDHAT